MRTTGFRSAIALALFSLLTPALAGPTQPPDGDVQDLELRIQGAEYAITAHEGRLQAPNRAHGFRTFFSEKGIRAVPRLEREGTWEWSLQWVGYGRGSDIVPVPAATVAPQGTGSSTGAARSPSGT
jgi:hypothetical protein